MKQNMRVSTRIFYPIWRDAGAAERARLEIDAG
jgi:hypothetical protein